MQNGAKHQILKLQNSKNNFFPKNLKKIRKKIKFKYSCAPKSMSNLRTAYQLSVRIRGNSDNEIQIKNIRKSKNI